MANWVLIHSPLLTTASWAPASAALQERGERTVVPDLSAALAARGRHARTQAELVAANVDVSPVTLVAHSGAGPVLPVVACHLVLRGIEVRGSIFVDAGLPHPGKARIDVLPEAAIEHLRSISVDGWVPPWPSWWSAEQLESLVADPSLREMLFADCPRLPETLFTEPLPVTSEDDLGRCSYLRLSSAYDAAADVVENVGWPVRRMSSSHLGPLTDAHPVVDALQALTIG